MANTLITAGVTLTRDRLAKLVEVGLDHVQLSIQDVEVYRDGKIWRMVHHHAGPVAGPLPIIAGSPGPAPAVIDDDG